MTRRRAAFVVAMMLEGCASPHTAPAPPPAPAFDSSPGLRIALAWNAPVDLDLYVTDPDGETICFANNPSRQDARLERDEKCGAAPPGGKIELVHIAAARPGRYRVGVDFVDDCATRIEQVGYRLIVLSRDTRRDITGTAERGRFRAVAFEIDLNEDTTDEP